MFEGFAPELSKSLNSLSGFRISSTWRYTFDNGQKGIVSIPFRVFASHPLTRYEQEPKPAKFGKSQFPFGFSHLIHIKNYLLYLLLSRHFGLNSLSGFRISSTRRWRRLACAVSEQVSIPFRVFASHPLKWRGQDEINSDKSQFPFGFSHLIHQELMRDNIQWDCWS